MKALIVLSFWLLHSTDASLAAEIVWSWLPNTHQYDVFPQRIGDAVYPSPDFPVRTIEVDMDGDGTVDFEFRATEIGKVVEILPAGTNEVIGANALALPLDREDVVSSLIPECSAWARRADFPPYSAGVAILGCVNPGECLPSPFSNQRHYAGVRFWGADGVHYGVLDVEGLTDHAGGILYGYGYNRVAGEPLVISQLPGWVRIAPPRIVRPGYIRLQWDSEIGKGYELQTKEVLWWYWVESGIIINATSTNTVVDIPLTGTARFFRLMRMD